MCPVPEVVLNQIEEGSDFLFVQKKLAQLNNWRMTPSFPHSELFEEDRLRRELFLMEARFVEKERAKIQREIKAVPRKLDEFMEWFEALRLNGPGQNSPLFPWLAEEATLEEMKWFIRQETAGEAGFEDLLAVTQVRIDPEAKLEMANNYWDEMGRGQKKGMHGPMLKNLVEEMEIPHDENGIVPEALALGNLMTAFAFNRRYAFLSIGALGVIELTAPGRAQLVHKGLRRLGLSPTAQRYYSLHAAIDIKHSADWNEKVIRPLIQANPRVLPFLAEGALLRLCAGQRCFERYMGEFGLFNSIQ